MASGAELAIIISGKDSGASAVLKSVADQAQKSFGGLADIASKAFLATGAAMAGGLAIGIKSAGDLQQSVANISTIKPDIDTSAVFNSLNQMSAKIGLDAKDLGDSLYNVFSSIDVSQEGALALTEKFAKGSKAASTDAATFGTSVLGVMNAYKLSVEDADHISDVFFNTVNAGVITGQELATSLGPVTGSAKAAGVSLDELGGLIAGVTKEGGPAAQNVNNLNNMLMKITTTDAIKAMSELGISTTDASGKFRSIPDILGDVKESLSTLSESERAAALQSIFPDAQARQGATTLMSQLDFVRGAIDTNKTSAGAAEAAFQKMNATFNSQVAILTKTFQSLLTSVGAEVLPMITPVIQAFAAQLPAAFEATKTALAPLGQIVKDAFVTIQQVFAQDWSPDASINPMVNAIGMVAIVARDVVIPALTEFVGFVQANALPILVGLGTAAATAFGMWAAAAVPAAIATAAALAPVLIPIAAIGLAAGVLAAAWSSNWGDIQGKTQAVVEFVSGVPAAIGGFFSAIGTIAQALATSVGDAFNSIPALLSAASDGISAILNGAWTGFTALIGDALNGIVTAIQEAWTNTIPGDIRADLELIGTTLATKFGDFLASVGTWLSSTLAAIGEGWTNITTAIGTALGNIWTAITTKVSEILTAVGTWLATLWTDIKTGWDLIATAIGEVLGGIWTSITGKLAEVVTAVSGWTEDVLGKFRSMVQPAAGIGADIVEGIKSGIAGGWGRLTDWVGDRARDLLNAAKRALDISSPSGEFETQVGEPIMDGIMLGMQNNLAPAVDLAASIGLSLVEKASLGIVAGLPTVATALDAFGSVVNNSLNEVDDRVDETFQKVLKTFNVNSSSSKKGKSKSSGGGVLSAEDFNKILDQYNIQMPTPSGINPMFLERDSGNSVINPNFFEKDNSGTLNAAAASAALLLNPGWGFGDTPSQNNVTVNIPNGVVGMTADDLADVVRQSLDTNANRNLTNAIR